MKEQTEQPQTPGDEGLELDRLDVDSKPAQATEKTRPVEQPSNTEAPSRERVTLFSQAFRNRLKNRTFYIPLLGGLGLSVMVLLGFFDNLFFDTTPHNIKPTGKIVYSVSSHLGFRHRIAFKLSIDYVNNEEKTAFLEKLPHLGDALAQSGNLPEIKEAIAEENLNILERHVLAVAQDTTGASVERLHIEQLDLDEAS